MVDNGTTTSMGPVLRSFVFKIFTNAAVYGAKCVSEYLSKKSSSLNSTVLHLLEESVNADARMANENAVKTEKCQQTSNKDQQSYLSKTHFIG